MRHRHRPELKPTDRLVLAALATATVPLSVSELSEATGSAPTTLTRTTRLLERCGLITRHRIGGLSNFTLRHVHAPTTTTPIEVTQ
jgi:DNA-binding MarR family transcriptional regulator